MDVIIIQNSRKRNRISFFIGLDFKVLTRRGSRETAALVVRIIDYNLNIVPSYSLSTLHQTRHQEL